MWQESLTLQSEMSNKQGILDVLEGLAGLAVNAGDAETMALLLGGADAQREAIGATVPPRFAEQREKDCAPSAQRSEPRRRRGRPLRRRLATISDLPADAASMRGVEYLP